MKHGVLAFFVFIMDLQVFAQSPAESVNQLMSAQQSAWNRGDISGFMEHYWRSDSLKFVGKKITYGWQNTFDNYKKAFPDTVAMGKLTFTLLEVLPLSDDAVFVVGKWALAKEKPASGHFTLLWRRVEGKWVIVTDHTS